MIQKFRKKPIKVEALQWTGQNHREMYNFLEGNPDEHMTASNENFYIDHNKVERGLIIKTSEGEMIARVNDYIIKEPFDKARKYYPCKPEVFGLTYEKQVEQVDVSSEEAVVNASGDAPKGIYSQEQIDYVNSVADNNLKDNLLHYVRLLDNCSDDKLKFENKVNTLENIIIDARKDNPNAIIMTMKECRDKHGDIDSYVKKFGK